MMREEGKGKKGEEMLLPTFWKALWSYSSIPMVTVVELLSDM
jgi:hypothetical protein